MNSTPSTSGRSPAALRAAIACEQYEAKRGPPDFHVGALTAIAETICGKRDWGDKAALVAGLNVLLDALPHEAGLDALGRQLLHRQLVRWLCNHLNFQAELKADPQLAAVPIVRPWFIVGFGRTGSTLLHRLLALDPEHRAPKFWELLEPCPTPGANLAADRRRISLAESTLRQMRDFTPQVLKLHPLEAESPDECHYLFDHTFVSPFFCLHFDVPSYFHWLQARTRTERASVYQVYRRLVQCLLRCGPRRRWISKTFVHQYFLTELLNEFPDARVVRLHREPRYAVSSMCSLIANSRSMYTPNVNSGRLGESIYQLTLCCAQQMLANAKTKRPDILFCDVFFEDISRDPVAVAKKIYDAFGYAFTGDLTHTLQQYVAANPRDKTGIHQHRLADFGINEERIETEFADYRAWSNSIREQCV